MIRALQSVNVIERSSMAFMLRSHNGVHCCGTVGDSHPVHYVDLFWPQHSSSKLDSAFGLRKRSQLSTAKCTFTGDSFQNHVAKVRISEQKSKYLFENYHSMFHESESVGLPDSFGSPIVEEAKYFLLIIPLALFQKT